MQWAGDCSMGLSWPWAPNIDLGYVCMRHHPTHAKSFDEIIVVTRIWIGQNVYYFQWKSDSNELSFY